MNASSNNPAGRLLKFISGSLAQEVKSRKAQDVFRAILGCESSPLPLFMGRLGYLLSLPQETHMAVTAFQLPIDYVVWVQDVRTRWDELKLSANWNHFADPFTPNNLAIMRLCDHALSGVSAERVADIDELIKLRDAVRELISEVLNAKIDATLQRFLLRNLYTIEQSILDFFLRGEPVFFEAAEELTGIWERHRGILDTVNDGMDQAIILAGKTQTLVQQFGAILIGLKIIQKLLTNEPWSQMDWPQLPGGDG